MTSFRVVSRSQIRHFRSSPPFYAPGSIPGSSTENKLVKAKSLWPAFFFISIRVVYSYPWVC